MKLLIIGIILVVLFITITGLVWFVTDIANALAVFIGGILPIAISIISIITFITLKLHTRGRKRYQRFVVINFLAKVVLIGLWTALIILSVKIPKGPFVVSLLANFLAWHIYEAYRYQQRLTVA